MFEKTDPGKGIPFASVFLPQLGIGTVTKADEMCIRDRDKSQYKDVYVFVEQREGVIQKVAIELLGKARELADSLNEKVDVYKRQGKEL